VTRSLIDLDWPARTARLTIRLAVAEDGERTWRFRQLESVSRWLTSAPASRQEFLRSFTEPDRLARTLVIESDGVIIGDLMLFVQDAWSQAEVEDRARGVQAELGWTLDPAYGGRGFASEAVAELIRISFEDLHLRRVTASCFADNEPSWRLMERVGMRRELHEIRGSLHRSGDWMDGFGYALLADEWHELRTGA
jgi:RimJ/RimL family protein N-acetyltransferase